MTRFQQEVLFQQHRKVEEEKRKKAERERRKTGSLKGKRIRRS